MQPLYQKKKKEREKLEKPENRKKMNIFSNGILSLYLKLNSQAKSNQVPVDI